MGGAPKEKNGVSYTSLELRDVRLSHTAVLYLLQGASLRQLFTSTYLGDNEKAHFWFAFAVVPQLDRLPVVLPRVVLAADVAAPGVEESAIDYALFLSEVGA